MGFRIYIHIYWVMPMGIVCKAAASGYRSPSRPLTRTETNGLELLSMYQEFVVLEEGINLGFVNQVLCIANTYSMKDFVMRCCCCVKTERDLIAAPFASSNNKSE